jgi:ferredoxin
VHSSSIRESKGRSDFRALHPERGLRFFDAACLRLRSRLSDCDACARACPVDAIRIDPTQTRVRDACTGCGRCAAACPTHALDASGFRVGDLAPAPPERPVTVDCWKVPRAASESDAVRVPCLGGLRVSDLLDLRAAAGPRPVRLIDRGWCSGCSSGGTRHPAEANLTEARALLADVGAAHEALPALESRPLPGRLMPQDIPPADAEAAVNRRNFLRHLVGRAAAAVEEAAAFDPGHAARPSFSARVERPATERSGVLAALRAAADGTGRTLPARLFPEAEASDACRNHNVCVANCPTEALRKYETDDGAAGVAFDAAECIDCGLCASVCPEQAMSIRAGARTAPPAGEETVTRFGTRECWHCGASFAPRADERHCAACAKSHALAAGAFRALFAVR